MPTYDKWTRLLGVLLLAVTLLLTGVSAVWGDGPGAVTAAAPAAAGTVQLGPVIKNSSHNGAPGCADAIVPLISSTTSVHVCATTARPEGGGGQHLAVMYTANGILAVADLQPSGYEECFGADVWPSRISKTLKMIVNCRYDGDGNGNDRIPVIYDTGIPADPVTDR